MKPTNWRQFYGYRPSRSLAWKNPPSHDDKMTRQYLRWLAREHGWFMEGSDGYPDADKAQRHVSATQHPCGIISAAYAPEPVAKQMPIKATRVDPVSAMCAKIRDKLTWEQVEMLQNAIDQRLAA